MFFSINRWRTQLLFSSNGFEGFRWHKAIIRDHDVELLLEPEKGKGIGAVTQVLRESLLHLLVQEANLSQFPYDFITISSRFHHDFIIFNSF